jgi:hypothetical protein
MSNRKYKTLRQFVESLSEHDDMMLDAADSAVAEYFDLYIPEWSQDGYRDLGGFVNTYPSDGKAPIVFKLEPQLRRAHMPIMLVWCRGMVVTRRVSLVGWIFRCEAWRDELKVPVRPGDDLPDCYRIPTEALYPVDTLRLLFPYRNPDGTPNMDIWPTPTQFRALIERGASPCDS